MKILSSKDYRLKLKKIEGIVNPTEWSNDGRPSKYAIYTPAEEDILLENYRFKSRLRQLVGKRVIAEGTLRKNQFNEKVLYLTRLRPLNSNGGGNESSAKNDMFIDELAISQPVFARLRQSDFFDRNFGLAI